MQRTVGQQNFELTALIKKHGLRVGFEARQAIAPKARAFAECTFEEREKIIQWMKDKYGPADKAE